MGSQDQMLASRLARLSMIKDELARVKAENARLRDEMASLRSHFDLALLAAADLAALPPGGRLVIFDGWNLVLGANRIASSRDELIGIAKKRLAENPGDFAWIVFDGPAARSTLDGRLRVTYTGGEGSQRTDRLVCDFLRMAALSGRSGEVEVVTDDRRFGDEARRLAARIGGPRP